VSKMGLNRSAWNLRWRSADDVPCLRERRRIALKLLNIVEKHGLNLLA